MLSRKAFFLFISLLYSSVPIAAQQLTYWKPLQNIVHDLGSLSAVIDICKENALQNKAKLTSEDIQSIKRQILSKDELTKEHITLLEIAYQEGRFSYQSTQKSCTSHAIKVREFLIKKIAKNTRFLLENH